MVRLSGVKLQRDITYKHRDNNKVFSISWYPGGPTLHRQFFKLCFWSRCKTLVDLVAIKGNRASVGYRHITLHIYYRTGCVYWFDLYCFIEPRRDALLFVDHFPDNDYLIGVRKYVEYTAAGSRWRLMVWTRWEMVRCRLAVRHNCCSAVRKCYREDWTSIVSRTLSITGYCNR